MSQRKVPLHFDESDPLDRSAWKRFGFRPEDERSRMFFETSPMNTGWPDWQSKFHRPHYDDPEWRGRTMFSQCGSDPESPSMQRRTRVPSGWSEDSVPIKVVHEKTPPRSNNDDGTDSETSSQASHGSQGSSSSQPQRARITREPRVHHIPIMVEPREGSTSSGYASDGAGEASVNNHEGENHHDQPSNEWITPNVQRLCKNFETPQTVPKSSGADSPRINSVPIRLNSGRADSPSRTQNHTLGQQASEQLPEATFGNAKPDSPGPSAFQPTAPPRQRSRASSQPPSSPQAMAGPHVTCIPMNMDSSEPTKEASEPEEKPEKKAKTGTDPLNQIADVLREVAALEKEVQAFECTMQDKHYRYLDEMLTRCMLRLDNIETEGREDIRQSRKAAIREVQKWINHLESKVRPPQPSVDNMEIAIIDEENGGRETQKTEPVQEMSVEEERVGCENSATKQSVNEAMEVQPGNAADAEESRSEQNTDSSLPPECIAENQSDQMDNTSKNTGQ